MTRVASLVETFTPTRFRALIYLPHHKLWFQFMCFNSNYLDSSNLHFGIYFLIFVFMTSRSYSMHTQPPLRLCHFPHRKL